MRLPLGDVVVDAAPLDVQTFKTTVQDLCAHSFNGYLAWTGYGYDGLEEGVFLFSSGKIVAVSYAHLKYGYSLDGPDALKLALNAVLTNPCAYTVVRFHPAKVNLVLAFNESARVSISCASVLKQLPITYDPSWVKGIIKNLSQQEIDRIRVLAKFGLTGVKVGEI